MSERRTCVSALVLVGCCLLQVCGAGKVPCTVTQGQGADQTTYSVPDEGGSDCSFSWTNASDPSHSVLAHEEGWKEDGPVRSANLSTLVTTECITWVFYRRYCHSEKEEHTSNCTIVCSKKVLPPEDHVAENKTTSPSWIIPVVIIVIIVIIISFVLLVGLIYFRRKRTCFYSPVNMKGVEAQAPV